MRVFVTGATGFIGFAVVQELLKAGHQALGLARSEAGAQSLRDAGVDVQTGSLEDLESLTAGTKAADAVIHCAFIHDWSNFAHSCAVDKRAIETLGAALVGSDRPLIVSAGVGLLAPGRLATEDMNIPADSVVPRVSEQSALALLSQGVNVSVMRLPQVHNTVKQGLVTPLVALAREKGVSAYVGDGLNRWAAAHILDVARLYRLALETHEAGARYHAVAEEGVPLRAIAEAIGRGLNVPVTSLTPEEASAHFGFFGRFAGLDMAASSALTQERLGWNPTGPGLVEDLDHMQYFDA